MAEETGQWEIGIMMLVACYSLLSYHNCHFLIYSCLLSLQAIWFTETPFQAGPVFGSVDKWKGMGILFDSFDNNGRRDNPYISLFINDGTIAFDHAT